MTSQRYVGRSALVTGGASGIGLACAQRFAADGYHVTVLDRDADGAEQVAKEIDGRFVVADLAHPETWAEQRFDADVVVSNAGLQHVSPVEDFPADTFGTMLSVMLEGPFRLAQSVLPSMYARGWGRFVHISSIHGLRASAYKAAYVVAKHGVEGLSKVLAVEGAPYGVTSNTICPGYVRTPLVESQLDDQARSHGIDRTEVLADVILARTPVKRLIEPSEVAHLAAFLCGPETDSITGASYELSGGWTAT